MNLNDIAKAVYQYCEAKYETKDARYDVIVECMSVADIEGELGFSNIDTLEAATQWADQYARLQHEVELNQAWDGPESCIGSSLYRSYEE